MAKQPCHQQDVANRSNTATQHPKARAPPRLTYSKRETRPLWLTARQFISDVNGAISDGDDEQTASSRKERTATKRATQGRSDPRTRKRTHTEGSKHRRRRLPVNELMLVTSPLYRIHDFDTHDPTSPAEAEDPIVDGVSSPLPGHGSKSTYTRRKEAVPLSVLRQRIIGSRRRLKDIRRVAKRRHQLPTSTTESIIHKGRDGFNNAEIIVCKSDRRVRKRKPTEKPLISGFGALQLCSGPLPAVVFCSTPTELTLSRVKATEHDDHLQLQDSGPDVESDGLMRRRSSDGRRREKLIQAQLSSISAPARLPSESSDSGEDREDEETSTQGDYRSVAFEDDYASEQDDLRFKEPTNHGAPDSLSEDNDYEIADMSPHVRCSRETNLGVNMDFCQPSNSGQLQRQPPGRQRLVEVNETILESAPVQSSRSNRPLRNGFTSQRMDSQAFPRASTRVPRFHTNIHSRGPIVANSTASTTVIKESDERNSVEASESQYFANATQSLHDPVRSSRHTVVPRRRSSYFLHPQTRV